MLDENTYNRRKVLALTSSATLSTAIFSNPVAAEKPSYDEKAEEIYRFNKELYGANEAEILTDKWVKLNQRLKQDDIKKQKANNIMRKYLLNNTKEIAKDIKDAEAKRNINGNYSGIEINNDYRTSDINTTSTELSPGNTDEGTSGGGTTETRLSGDTWMEARCWSAGWADSRAWVERAGYFWVPEGEGGNYEITCTYTRRGSVNGNGSAEIDLFVEHIGGNRRTELVDSGDTNGDQVTNSAGFYLSGYTDYLIGIHLDTQIQGIGYTLTSDYFSSLRGVNIKSLSVQKL